LGLKREDRFLTPFFWLATKNISGSFSYLLRHGDYVRARGHCKSSRRSARR
jgi:hypothetical protein